MHSMWLVCSLANKQEYIVLERFPRLSGELSLFCILVDGAPATLWVSPYNLNEWIEYTISE